MNQDKSTSTTGAPASHDSEAEKARREAGKTEHSSHDHTSREKAGSDEGAGGGAKQKQQH